ncbi:MAG: GNAT family N-acetyltransferase [Clostridiales bacterium]|nr:GNAT family N-acetyltransferase [Clostridiales bacterium]
MDKSIKHIPVLMVNHDPAHYPRYDLPAGYTFSADFSDFRADWTAVALSSGLLGNREDALRIFDAEFAPRPDLWPARFAFVVDGNGTPAGIAALWDDLRTFGRPLRKFHWVGVDAAHERRGIGRALLTRIMDLNGGQGPLFLESQTTRYDALNLYAKFGFRPYMGVTPAAWLDAPDAADRLGRAWTIVADKLAQYGARLPDPALSIDRPDA